MDRRYLVHKAQGLLKHNQVVRCVQSRHTLFDHVTHLQNFPMDIKSTKQGRPVPIDCVNDHVLKLFVAIVGIALDHRDKADWNPPLPIDMVVVIVRCLILAQLQRVNDCGEHGCEVNWLFQ